MCIELPPYTWFVNGHGGACTMNVFTGSCGTDPYTGCLNTTTFHYKVYVIPSGEVDKERLVAEWHRHFPWHSKMPKEKPICAEFESSAEGLRQAERWLSEAAEKYTLNQIN